jgi:hypothetical protein
VGLGEAVTPARQLPGAEDEIAAAREPLAAPIDRSEGRALARPRRRAGGREEREQWHARVGLVEDAVGRHLRWAAGGGAVERERGLDHLPVAGAREGEPTMIRERRIEADAALHAQRNGHDRALGSHSSSVRKVDADF